MARTAVRNKARSAPVEDIEDEDVEEVDEEEAPRSKKADAPTRGTAWLTEYVNEECGTTYSPATIRILLRKLVKDGALEREIGEDRSRYNFNKGANDPTVKAVVKAVKSGAVAAERKASLEKVKASAAAKKGKAAPAEEEPAPRRRRSAAKTKAAVKPKAVIDDDDFEDEVEDL